MFACTSCMVFSLADIEIGGRSGIKLRHSNVFWAYVRMSTAVRRISASSVCRLQLCGEQSTSTDGMFSAGVDLYIDCKISYYYG